jgi:hypothetical protein
MPTSKDEGEELVEYLTTEGSKKGRVYTKGLPGGATTEEAMEGVTAVAA